MKEAVGLVPGILWFALIWTGLAFWAQDVRGMYIALFCVALAPLQAWRSAKAARPAG
jgi:hypothetical protein